MKGATQQPLIYGPNIKDWPELGALTDNIVLKVCSKILDEVTTTDELIPSGETSSYRSNPIGLAEFTLSRRDPVMLAEVKRLLSWKISVWRGMSARWQMCLRALSRLLVRSILIRCKLKLAVWSMR